MAAILAFGRYLPKRILDNAQLAKMLNCDAAGIVDSCGIEERRIAAPEETVAGLAERASRHCLERASLHRADVDTSRIGLIILSSGTSERRFPGPAAQLAQQLGLAGVPAIDLPLASAGGLFGLALAAQLAPAYGLVLVAAAEKMSGAGLADPLDRNVAILFGDGAGACLVGARPGGLEIVDSVLHSDGAYARDLCLEFTGPVQMNGRSVIMQASRRIPSAITEILGRNGLEQSNIRTFLLHQANRNLMERIAKMLSLTPGRFFSNIRQYGNTSSASLLIAASEWSEQNPAEPGDWACLAAFGAGFHWGAVLVRQA